MSAEAILVEASRLLAHPKITPRVEELRASLHKRHAATVDRIVEEYPPIAFAKIFDSPRTPTGIPTSVEHLPPRLVAVKANATKKKGGEHHEDHKVPVLRTWIKLVDKSHALEPLAKIFGLRVEPEEPGKLAVPAGERPQSTGVDHLAGLAKRSAALLRAIDGANSSDTVGKLNGAAFDCYGKGRHRCVPPLGVGRDTLDASCATDAKLWRWNLVQSLRLSSWIQPLKKSDHRATPTINAQRATTCGTTSSRTTTKPSNFPRLRGRLCVWWMGSNCSLGSPKKLLDFRALAALDRRLSPGVDLVGYS